jgi:Mrp family chromosome partitioning ATPase
VLESHKTKNLINELRQEYDYIIIDSPPVLSVTDAIIISTLVDGVIYVVAYKKTKKEDAKQGLIQLQKNNARVLGSVFANVDVRKSRTGYYGYYY